MKTKLVSLLNDATPQSKTKLLKSLDELDDLEFVVKIGLETQFPSEQETLEWIEYSYERSLKAKDAVLAHLVSKTKKRFFTWQLLSRSSQSNVSFESNEWDSFRKIDLFSKVMEYIALKNMSAVNILWQRHSLGSFFNM